MNLWAWNAQLGLMAANGGKQSTRGSLMCESGVNLRLVREDDPARMQENLLLGGEPATIRRTYDLIERGLTWRPDVEESRELAELRKEIRYDFRNLTS